MRSLLLAGVVFFASGCAHQVFMEELNVEKHGARVYDKPASAVFRASESALKALGYTVAHSDSSTGVIVTNKKAVTAPGEQPQMGSGYLYQGGHNASMPTLTRQYSIRVSAGDTGQTRVVAKPSIFSGTQDLSTEEVWVMEGQAGEQAQWLRLFDQIETYL